MTSCPWCDAENIGGADVCVQCGQPIDDLHLADPESDVERSLLRDRIGILEPRRAIAVSPQATVDQALKLLAEHRIGCVLVVDQGELVGIFSERDALYRIGADVEACRSLAVANYMTPKVQTLDLQAKVAFAVHMMDLGHYRHVPIVREDGSLLGIISVRDILRYFSHRTAASA